jgi:hypothetical protein
MPLLQTPGPAPDFTANAFVNGAIGNVALRDYKVSQFYICVYRTHSHKAILPQRRG